MTVESPGLGPTGIVSVISAGAVVTDPATAPTRSPIACRSTSPAETPATSSTRSSAVRLSSREDRFDADREASAQQK